MNALSAAGNPMLARSSAATTPGLSGLESATEPTPEVKKVFQQFTAGTFYRQMLAAMHKGHDKPAYFDGGHAEEVFRSELDSRIADDLAEKHGEAFAGPLYDKFSNDLLSAQRT